MRDGNVIKGNGGGCDITENTFLYSFDFWNHVNVSCMLKKSIKLEKNKNGLRQMNSTVFQMNNIITKCKGARGRGTN